MKFIQNNRSLILAVIVFAIAIGAYRVFFKTTATQVAANLSAQGVGNDVLDLYASLQAVTLDQGLFNSNLYKRLTDFSTEIPVQAVGRKNPFDVIGRE